MPHTSSPPSSDMLWELHLLNLDVSTSIGNILPDSTAAPALQGQQKELEKHMRANSLEQKIQQRPKPEELVKEGILQEDENPVKG